MLELRVGTWIASSKVDPRWNASGRGVAIIEITGPGRAGILVETPDEMKAWLKSALLQYGYAPVDLEQAFVKDPA